MSFKTIFFSRFPPKLTNNSLAENKTNSSSFSRSFISRTRFRPNTCRALSTAATEMWTKKSSEQMFRSFSPTSEFGKCLQRASRAVRRGVCVPRGFGWQKATKRVFRSEFGNNLKEEKQNFCSEYRLSIWVSINRTNSSIS